MLKIKEKTVTHLTCDSRTATEHSAFVCLVGQNTDGHSYAQMAYDNGCRVFVCSRALSLPEDATQMLYADTRIALAELSAEFYGYPADRLKLIGITGTKGKSTTASLICDVLNASGIPTDIIGTNGMTVGGVHEPTVNSTPESLVLHDAFARMEKAGTVCAVMEVSSQAYKMHRVHGLHFDIGIYTNLSNDHIGPGEHADFEEYKNCKASLFSHSKLSVVNTDDAYGAYMLEHAMGKVLTYGVDEACDFCGSRIELVQKQGIPGVRFVCGGVTYSLPMPGTFNVYNALAAIAVASTMGVDSATVSRVFEKASVTGRFQRIDCFSDRSFYVDYSHNGLALHAALGALRAYRPKRLICLFGSVGERTQMRRRELGQVAGELCDFCIITSDNPGREDPDAIIAEIERYVGDCPHICITDRREAIMWAVAHSRPGDLILFAGKGHETYQLIGREHVPFCEKDIILKAAQALRR